MMNRKKTVFPKNYFEVDAWQKGLYTCGLDEVGRGCLAGPVVVAAVIIPQKTRYKLLLDSKIMTEAERNKAYAWITKNCYWATAIVSHTIIDNINIYQATRYAMKKALLNLITTLPIAYEQVKYILIDALPLSLPEAYTHSTLEFHHFPKGESLSSSIAAASIVAKVTRDALMSSLIHEQFPTFGFKNHKGYATKQHIEALNACGPSIIHRVTFTQNPLLLHNDEIQQKLF